jgi:hypothetical protein
MHTGIVKVPVQISVIDSFVTYIKELYEVCVFIR